MGVSGWLYFKFLSSGNHEPPQAKYGEIIISDVAITDVDVLLAPHLEEKRFIVLKGIIADQCSQLKEPTVQLQDKSYVVSIQAYRPADADCDVRPRSIEKLIEIDIQDLAAGTYTVQADSVSQSFSVGQ